MARLPNIFPSFLISASLLLGNPAWAGVAEDYAQLQKWEFSQPIPVPAGGIAVARDTATWTLQSGSVRIIRPLASGAVTGIVFEGTGRFRMTIPDRYELAQLRRFADKTLDGFDEPITQLVLRTSDAALIALFPRAPEPASYAPQPLASKRHEQQLVRRFSDTDALVLAALLNPGAEKTVIDAHTAAFDWLTWDYDSTQSEEISVTRYHPMLPEIWISIDRAEDRRAGGRPGSRDSANAALQHIDVKADLTKRGQTGEVGRHGQRTADGHYAVVATFIALASSVSALRLELWPIAREVLAFDEYGKPLILFRDHIGRRSGMLDNKLYDNDVTIVLPAPLRRGETRRIRFEYDLETANFAPGNIWYPTVAQTSDQKHTARLELTVRKNTEVRAMGRMESRREDEKSETTVWLVERPAKMVTFSTATRFEEVRVAPDGIPPVIAFGPDFQFDNRDRMHNVGSDVANSMLFFQELFGARVGGDSIYVTSIASRHGQAFDGFLHMGEFTFTAEEGGASELFRAHEVAHEWWGHKVAPKSYRDWWLSEAFAEYSAMLFVRETVKNGERYFEEMLRSHEGIVKGNLAGGFSKFNRPGLIELSGAERRRTGPIGHGRRAITGDVQTAYIIQTYHKGPLVLHMLRMLLSFKTGSDAVFHQVLRDFVREFDGKLASTEDFQQVLERNAPGDWSSFFDAWVFRGDIPSFSWRYDVAQAADGYDVTVTLQRRDVEDGVRVIVPLRIAYDGGSEYLFLVSDRESQSVTQRVRARPRTVTFGPDHSLLAYVRRD